MKFDVKEVNIPLVVTMVTAFIMASGMFDDKKKKK